MTHELTYDEYQSTFSGKMIDVTNTAEPVVDIWPYVEDLVAVELVLKYVFDNELVELVYRNNESTFDHVLLPTADKDAFVVIVVDIFQKIIYGHYKLELKKLYGLE